MPINIVMPALSPTMTEGTLARWLVGEGEAVSPGDVIAEIETDKATMEVEAVDEGILGRIVIPDGTENVAVNAVIGILVEEGEDAPASEDPPRGAPRAAPGPAEESAGPPSAAPEPAAPAVGGEARVFATPLARRMARQAGLDIAGIVGSGPRGRVVKADIDAAMRAEPAPAAASGAGRGETVRLSAMRRVIAERMTESKSTVPHFYLTVDCEIDAMLAFRAEINRRAAPSKVSVNDVVIRACAAALREAPGANVSWAGEGRMIRHEAVDVSVAVAVPGGLVTPIVRDADRKGLVEIAGETKSLAARAREGKLDPSEYQGGSFTVSNLGMYGVKQFDAVVNPPQACILAVGAAERRPVARDDQLAVATVMTCTLSVDHRVVDGTTAAGFLGAVKSLIEYPPAMLA